MQYFLLYNSSLVANEKHTLYLINSDTQLIIFLRSQFYAEATNTHYSG